MRISCLARWITLGAAVAATGVLVVSSSEMAPQAESVTTAATEPASAQPGERDCAGVFFPIELTIESPGAAEAGTVSTATVRVSTKQPMGEIEITYKPSSGLEWLAPTTTDAVERLLPGDVLERSIAVRLPASLERRVVEVTVRGWIHGLPMERSTIWSLNPGGEEPYREVTRSDGSRVREVAARRIR